MHFLEYSLNRSLHGWNRELRCCLALLAGACGCLRGLFRSPGLDRLMGPLVPRDGCLCPSDFPLWSQVPSSHALFLDFYGLIPFPFCSTIVLSEKRIRFQPGFPEVSRKKDPWKEWGRYPYIKTQWFEADRPFNLLIFLFWSSH